MMQPIHQVCPICGHDDPENLSWHVEGPGLWRYTCTDPSHPDPYSWDTTGVDVLQGGGNDGLSHELGIYDDLLACFAPDGPLLEYGVIEMLYAERNPLAYRRLVDLYSHTAFGETKYSASAFIGAALGKLHREGLLRRVDVKATGYWSYNGWLTAAALAGSQNEAIMTWAEFAAGRDLDPVKWPAVLFG